MSFEASERYISLMHTRKLILNKGFTITEEENLVLKMMISSRNWGKFTKQPPISITNIVRELYANADEHRKGRVMVRGKMVPFDSSSINRFYGLPDIVKSDYIS